MINHKIEKVINSCVTEEQMKAAGRYLELAKTQLDRYEYRTYSNMLQRKRILSNFKNDLNDMLTTY